MSDYTPDEYNQIPDDSDAVPPESEWDLGDDSYEESWNTVDEGEIASFNPSDENSDPALVFEELSLWQVLGLLFFRPIRVGQQLFRVVMNADMPEEAFHNDEYEIERTEDDFSSTENSDRPQQRFSRRHPTLEYQLSDAPNPQLWQMIVNRLGLDRQQAGVMAMLVLAIMFAFIGSGLLRESALDPLKKAENDLGGSSFWFLLSAFSYISAVTSQYFQRRVQQRQETTSFTQQASHENDDFFGVEQGSTEPVVPIEYGHDKLHSENDRIQAFFTWFERHSMRFALVPIALILSWLAYDRNVAVSPDGTISGILFSRGGFMSWILAIFCWYLIFVVDMNGIFTKVVRERQSIQEAVHWQMPRFQWRWVHVGVLLIMGLAAYFRLDDLQGIPPQMTSDHIEKLIDAVKVDDGVYTVFFPNNGGREAFQMYAIAAVADWGGVGFNFKALKYTSVIEGLLTVFLAFWVAKEIIGRETEEQRQLGNWVGLSMGALLAISSWHTMVSRLGLRIVLTPLTVMIVVYFLVRAIRYNRRVDFVNMGLVLGFGTYFYQANRMLPILVVVVIGITIVFKSRGNFEIIWRYATNLLFCGVIALVIYLPMHRYSQEFPREFWNRTYGRIFGEGSFDCIDAETGQLDFCEPSFIEMYELLQEQRYGPTCEPNLFGTDLCQTGFESIRINYKNAFLSYMWEGDGQWITNGGGYPALDSRTSALYMLGLLMLVVLIIARRDIALVVVPLGILILLFPSALAIAPTLKENPSFTRTSGTIPFVFFVAALPLGTLAYQIVKAGKSRSVYYSAAALVIALVVYNAARPNYDAYFDVYRDGYERAWKPYDQIADPIKTFAEGRGSFGNAFMVGYPHWLDHRIVGQVAGDLNWSNNLSSVQQVYEKIVVNQGTPYEYNPEQPILFMVNLRDTDTLNFLEQNFPGGQVREVYADRNNNYYLYEAPPGWSWLASRITTQTSILTCIINCQPGPQ